VCGFVLFMFLSRLSHVQTSPKTQDSGAIQKCSDFLRAFMLGFDVKVRKSLERKRNREREKKRERERVCVCVCVCA
jgi:hypothetical protein